MPPRLTAGPNTCAQPPSRSRHVQRAVDVYDAAPPAEVPGVVREIEQPHVRVAADDHIRPTDQQRPVDLMCGPRGQYVAGFGLQLVQWPAQMEDCVGNEIKRRIEVAAPLQLDSAGAGSKFAAWQNIHFQAELNAGSGNRREAAKQVEAAGQAVGA